MCPATRGGGQPGSRFVERPTNLRHQAIAPIPLVCVLSSGTSHPTAREVRPQRQNLANLYRIFISIMTLGARFRLSSSGIPDRLSGCRRMIGMYCSDCGTARALRRHLLLTPASIAFLLISGTSQACAQQIIFDGAVEPGDPAHIDGNTDLYVGTTAFGRLSILDGATVTSGQGIVGENSLGEVVVSGSGSRWHSTSWIRAGAISGGRIELADGGAAESVQAVAGESVRGEVLMRSGASWDVLDQFTVGLFAEGSCGSRVGPDRQQPRLCRRESGWGRQCHRHRGGINLADDGLEPQPGQLWRRYDDHRGWRRRLCLGRC